jgi:hypothetical protein
MTGVADREGAALNDAAPNSDHSARGGSLTLAETDMSRPEAAAMKGGADLSKDADGTRAGTGRGLGSSATGRCDGGVQADGGCPPRHARLRCHPAAARTAHHRRRLIEDLAGARAPCNASRGPSRKAAGLRESNARRGVPLPVPGAPRSLPAAPRRDHAGRRRRFAWPTPQARAPAAPPAAA